MRVRHVAVWLVALVPWTAVDGAGVTFTLEKQLDMAALGAGVPASVAAYGDHLYVGSLSGAGRLYHISNPLGTPGSATMFGGLNDPATNGGLSSPGPTTNGYTNLYTDGVTLIAATSNGGDTPDIAQAYQFGGTNLNWGGNAGPSSMNTQLPRLDGAAVDPVSGMVMMVAFGGDKQNFFNPTTGTAVTVSNANILYYNPGVKTGWRDVTYDHATGDIYLRAVKGAARGERIATGRFVTLNGMDAGIQTIMGLDALTLGYGYSACLNIEYLPTGFAGEELVVVNDRVAAVNGGSFADAVKTYSATPPLDAFGYAEYTQVPVSFVLADGVTPFTTTSSASGIYDFSYNPVNNRLFISDYSTSQVHVFRVPGPSPTPIVIDVPSGTQTQTQAGYPTLSGSIPVVKTGVGTLVLDQANTLTGSMTVQGGVARLADGGALSSSTLAVVAGGTAQVAPYLVAGVGGLNLSGTGLVDLTNGGLTVAAGLSPTELVAQLVAGRNGGTWDGTSGITSSVTAAQVANSELRAVGWLDNGDGSLTAAYAAQGDANLDWVVDILDVANFVGSGKYGTPDAATWSEGDFNYDGVVDIQDVADFAATGLYGGASYNSPSGIAAVPEPASWTALVVGAALIHVHLGRRRRE